MISAKVICDSISPDDVRLTTMEVCMPRFILAEFNTHRQFSRNSASSRAIPVKKILEQVMANPFVPKRFPKNEKGMQAKEFYEPGSWGYEVCKKCWLQSRNAAFDSVRDMTGLKNLYEILACHVPDGDGGWSKEDYDERIECHKQIANRLLEPFMWHTVIVSSTEWSNFFAQRVHPDAQPEMQETANLMLLAYLESKPNRIDYGQWTLPYVSEEELQDSMTPRDAEAWKKVSAARCARVSYLQHDGTRDFIKDLDLCNKLVGGMHMSPFEHVATPFSTKEWMMIREGQYPLKLRIQESKDDEEKRLLSQRVKSMEFLGNFRGWTQLRKTFDNECR